MPAMWEGRHDPPETRSAVGADGERRIAGHKHQERAKCSRTMKRIKGSPVLP
jgi:hypothetical protein